MKAFRKEQIKLDTEKRKIICEYNEIKDCYETQIKMIEDYVNLPDILTINDDGEIIMQKQKYDLPILGFNREITYNKNNKKIPEILERIVDQICRNFVVEKSFGSISIYPPMSKKYKNKVHAITIPASDISISKRFFISVGSDENLTFKPQKYFCNDDLTVQYFCKNGECLCSNGVPNTGLNIELDSEISVSEKPKKGFRGGKQRKDPFRRYFVVLDYDSDPNKHIKYISSKFGEYMGKDNEYANTIAEKLKEGSNYFSADKIDQAFDKMKTHGPAAIDKLKTSFKSFIPEGKEKLIDRLTAKLKKYIEKNDIRDEVYGIVPKNFNYSTIIEDAKQSYNDGANGKVAEIQGNKNDDGEDSDDCEDIDYEDVEDVPAVSTTHKVTETSYPDE